MMTLWTGFKQQNFASDNTIGPNEEEATVALCFRRIDTRLRVADFHVFRLIRRLLPS